MSEQVSESEFADILVNRIIVTELAYATEDVLTSLSSLFPSLQDQVESSRSMIVRLSHEIAQAYRSS